MTPTPRSFAGDIAVLIACHNRRQKTLECLAALYSQSLPEGLGLRVFLVDDGSSDGTGDAVRAAYPQTRVIQGDGSLYWCGGMRLAWETAAREDPAAYLWLNDDTRAFPGALATLIAEWAKSAEAAGASASEHAVIVVACTRDPETGRPSFGEIGRKGLVPPPEKRSRDLPLGHSFNGNLVLVSRAAFLRLGNLNSAYRHSFGDVDYGLRAPRAGVRVIVAAGFLADCQSNPPATWQRADAPLRERWKSFHSPKGYPPREAAVYFRVAHGWAWPFWVARVYWHVLFPRARRESSLK